MLKCHHLVMTRTCGILLTLLLVWMTALTNQQIMMFWSIWRTDSFDLVNINEYTPQEPLVDEMHWWKNCTS